MDSNTFMGLLITAIIALLTGASIITAIIIRPIINLNKKLTKVDASLERGTEVMERCEKRIEKHGQELDKHNDELKKFEGRISALEARNS